MTVPPAALPGQRVNAPTSHHPDQGGEQRLGCPMCLNAENLLLLVPATHYHTITVRITRGTTHPEHTVDRLDARPAHVQDTRPVGVHCENCRWEFKGDNPLSKLVPVE